MPNLCITCLGIPGISDICHAKTSRFFLKKSDEHEFLIGVELGAETMLFVDVVGVHLNLVCVPLLLLKRRLIYDWLV
jgi:hypothetical protein